jgi:short-subunit dehydrogenase
MPAAIDRRAGRTVVAITGASSGIGAEFARRLAAGHDLILIARRRDRLEILADELSESSGSRIEILEADLTVERDVETAAVRLKSEKRLALLVNNAGFGTRGLFWEASLESQEQMHKLHIMATVRLTHAALKGMVQRDFGAVVNVSSVAAFVRSAGGASYCATKSWMTVFTETLHLELKSRRPNVIVQPHHGTATVETREKMGRMVIENIVAKFEGRALPSPVA